MPHIQTLEITNEYAKFVLEPLERGYGQTIGNALRRVMLSSIHGAAVSAIKVDKVFHEFSAIPGVKEDTTELLLNLKDLAIRWNFDGPAPEEAVIRLDVKGPGRVTGADVQCPDGLTIMNPECYLATISDSKATLSAEFYIGWGSGYVLPGNQERYKGVIGIIPTGAQYTPVKKVNYIVEATRVGQRIGQHVGHAVTQLLRAGPGAELERADRDAMLRSVDRCSAHLVDGLGVGRLAHHGGRGAGAGREQCG